MNNALLRPQTGYYCDITEEATALWESLTINYGFVDGNRPVGFAVTYSFLRVNGIKITANATDTTKFVLSHLEAGNFTKNNLDDWLRANTKMV